MDNLPSDITLTKWKKEYELYKEAHNGLPEYLSYELECTKKELQAERDKVALLRSQIKEINRRAVRTLETLCRCADGGVGKLHFCPACRFKHSFN